MNESIKRIANTSARLKEIMLERNLKQAELAEMSGIDKGSINHYISGKYEPKQTSIYRLAMVLGVSEMWLWGYNAPKERQIQNKSEQIDYIVEDAEMKWLEMYRKLDKSGKETVKLVLESQYKRCVEYEENLIEDAEKMSIEEQIDRVRKTHSAPNLDKKANKL